MGFAVALAPILLLGLGCLEVAHWLFLKQAISLALVEAGRAAITQHASPAVIETAFEHALQPLYPPTAHATAAQRVQQALRDRQARQPGVPPWQIQILSPGSDAFIDFAQPGLNVPGAASLPAIDNDYQALQHQRHQGHMGTEGRGTASGLTIFQANALVLRLTYPHQPLVPGIGGLLRVIAATSKGYRKIALAAGYLPIQQEIVLTMQSHPVLWPDLPSRKVVRTAAYEEDENAAWAENNVIKNQPHCRGLWCAGPDRLQAYSPPAAKPPGNTSTPPMGSETSGGAGMGRPVPPATTTPDSPTNSWPDHPESAGTNDPLCGISLCCEVV